MCSYKGQVGVVVNHGCNRRREKGARLQMCRGWGPRGAMGWSQDMCVCVCVCVSCSIMSDFVTP